MQRTRIEWTDYIWNPIKGLCPHDCWYCYARKIYERFGWNTELSWDGRVPLLSNKKPSKIFVCSTMEMFHPEIPKEWRDRIFQVIEVDYNRKHTFQILTKFPQNIDRPMPDNVWLGVTITKNKDIWRRNCLVITDAKVKFISFEPLLERLDFTLYEKIDWIIIGRLTQHGHKYDPKKEWIREIARKAHFYEIPLFLKNNLNSIMGDYPLQLFPKGVPK